MKRLLMICSLLGAAVSVNAQTSLTISIKTPATGSRVDQRHDVTGAVSNPEAQVWVVIHPIDTSEYWVQPAVTVKNDGTWRVRAYFGEPGPGHAGKEFEVRAFANPSVPLREGKTGAWPKAAARSEVVEVTRR